MKANRYGLLGINKDVVKSTSVMVVQLYECTKNHGTVHIKWVNRMIYEYFNKAVVKISV